MHILYIYSEITIKGGADKVIVDKANYFAQNGYNITLVTESQLGRELSFPLNPKVQHIDMNLDFNRQYSQSFIHRAFTYYFLMQKYKRKLKSVLFHVRPDIVITTLGRSLDFITDIHDGSVKIGEAHTTKNHLRSLHLMENKGRLYKIIARRLRDKMIQNVSRLQGLVLLTPQDAADWKDVVKTFVIPNSMPSFPAVCSSLDKKQVIMVGRYNDAKGYDYLIPAWEIVHKKHPDWFLNVYGSGELHDNVIDWVHKKQLEKTIILHDPVDNILDKYLDSSICVMSSRYEGFPMALIEALSCGVPCVSFDCPFGPRNIIIDGNDGILVEYLNSQALADGICRLIEDEDLRKEMGQNGRKNICRYSREKIMQQWVDLFESLVKGKKS